MILIFGFGGSFEARTVLLESADVFQTTELQRARYIGVQQVDNVLPWTGMTPDVQNAYYGSMGTLIIGILTMLGGVVFFALAGSSATNESARESGSFFLKRKIIVERRGTPELLFRY